MRTWVVRTQCLRRRIALRPTLTAGSCDALWRKRRTVPRYRGDAHEVGTFGAIIEGLITGGLYALLGGGAFLVLARSRVNR